ncbi:taurine ABC transporter substrate-binding protein [Pseudorhodoferax aquiterrae]|uniref:Taurine ABC transporter substrate-binding protein n=1 Tax=Pseudorhodoferax aquiterrae TaxID=747304 RepID=A0ABQ3FZV6_9BURK|nr:ABC transporter substrate-binding protein [Pseudorhodoferax aquiterrae]GHC77076.1 taurine ABC transporter substrate-binding protein [Pseudorhodoferax aquiterrae]
MQFLLSRREFQRAAAQMFIASSAGLVGTAARAQARQVRLGTFGSIDAQNYIRAKDAIAGTFGPGVTGSFVTVRAGSEVISAMAGGSLDICNIGSSPMVVGYANGLKASMVYVYKSIVDSECMVVQGNSGINTLAELRGKKIGLPFNTSVHFAAIAALKTAGLGIADVRLINMRADQIASAWQRREIDAAYIWVPVVPRLTDDGGRIIFKTGDLADKSGLVIFDGLLVRDEFKQQSPDLVLAFLKDFEKIAQAFKQDPKDVVATMTKFLGVDEPAVMRSLNTFYPVPAREQVTSKWMGRPGEKGTGVEKTLQTQAQFLQESGQIAAMPKDWAGLVDASFVAKMA